MNGHQRLWSSLLASASIHVAVLFAPSMTAARFAPPEPLARQPAMKANLVSQASFAPSSVPPVTASRSAAPVLETDDRAPPLQQTVQLLAPPDFSEVELLPTPFPITLRFEFRVAANGQITELLLIKSSPVPSHLQPVLDRAMRSARFSPAIAGGRPVAGRFVMHVEVQPVPPGEAPILGPGGLGPGR